MFGWGGGAVWTVAKWVRCFGWVPVHAAPTMVPLLRGLGRPADGVDAVFLGGGGDPVEVGVGVYLLPDGPAGVGDVVEDA